MRVKTGTAAASTWCCLIIVALAEVGGPRAAAAEDELLPLACSPLPRPGDELWNVRTGSAGCGLGPLGYRVYDSGNWRLSDEHEFLSPEHSQTTVFYVHGLAVNDYEAYCEGWMVYRALARSAPVGLPLRLVIYAWPSNLNRRPLRAAHMRQNQTDLEGQRLTRLLEQMRPVRPTSLIGHSSGARVIAATLESLAARAPHANSAGLAAAPRPLRAIFLAGAVDNSALLPGHCYGQAISQVEQMLNLFDPCDRVLRWYRFLGRGHSGPEAVGYTGMAGRLPPAESVKLRQINASPHIGNQHSLASYLSSPALLAELRCRGVVRALSCETLICRHACSDSSDAIFGR